MAAWSTTELAFLRDHAEDGAEMIAEVLGRSAGSVKSMASRHGISLRTRDERRGRWQGEIPEARDAMTHLRRLGVSPHVMQPSRFKACPKCGNHRPRISATGFCRTCHVRWLQEELAAHEAEAREYETALLAKDVQLHQEKRDRDSETVEINCPACGDGFTAKGRPSQRRRRWKQYQCPHCASPIVARLKKQ